MLIDEIQDMQKRGEPLRPLEEGSSNTAEGDALEAQLEKLDDTCPRYDVHNVYRTLFPDLLETDNPIAVKRNSEAMEKRNSLIHIAGKAPIGPPWFLFALEYRYNQHQRIAFLVRWDKENRKYVCISMFDGVDARARYEYIPEAFEILLGDDDMFGGYVFRPDLKDLDSAKEAAETVRTCIELLNWDREDVPTQALTNPKSGKQAKNGSGGRPHVQKSDPIVIKFEPFLKSMRAGTHRGTSTGTHAAVGQHLVKGHYANFTFAHPMFGHKPVLGRTYGRIWMRPSVRGNPQFGTAKAPRGVIKIGNVTDPTASQPLIPFPPQQKKTGSD